MACLQGPQGTRKSRETAAGSSAENESPFAPFDTAQPGSCGSLVASVDYRRSRWAVRGAFVVEHVRGRKLTMVDRLPPPPLPDWLSRMVPPNRFLVKPSRPLPSLIGLGFSDKPRDPHALEYHAAKIEELVDGLELDRLILVVQDWGGPIGMLAMASRPERLALDSACSRRCSGRHARASGQHGSIVLQGAPASATSPSARSGSRKT